MNVRIIAGRFGGRLLDAPDGSRTHPMGERVRNALFNILGDELKGAVVLDLFAGTGAVGLEALSRGASHVTFVEKDRVAQKILASNIARLGVEGETLLVRATVSQWCEQTDELYDLVLADPPYHDLQLSTVMKAFALLKPGALMVLSHTGRGEVPTETGIVVVDNRSYGNAYLTLYRRDI